MRQVFFMEAWKVYVACTPRKRLLKYEPWSDVLLSRYRLLLGNPHLAANVRYGSLFVNLEYPAAGSNRSKDSGCGFRVHFRQTRKGLCQVSHRFAQPPHP